MKRRIKNRLLISAATVAVVCASASVAFVAPAGAAPASVRVKTNADSGPGSLRAALVAASADSAIEQIVIAPQVGEIDVVSATLVFTGTQPLTIDGGGVRLDASGLGAGDVLRSTVSPSITIRDLQVANGPANGINVQGVADVNLLHVTAMHNAGFGVLADDAGAPDHGVSVAVTDSLFDGNGASMCDTDGLRVNESGDGTLEARLVGVTATANQHDGVELDERGAGDAVPSVRSSTFTGNGANAQGCVDENGALDPEDGFDVDELDAGDLIVDVANGVFSNNFEEGIDLDEGDDVFGATDPENDGDLVVTIKNVVASGNGFANAADPQDNIDIDENGDGNYNVTMANIVANDGAADGYDGGETGVGDMQVDLTNVTLDGNGGRGSDLRSQGTGVLTATFTASVILSNGSGSIRARQDTVVPHGTLTLVNTTFSPAPSTTNVDLVVIP